MNIYFRSVSIVHETIRELAFFPPLETSFLSSYFLKYGRVSLWLLKLWTQKYTRDVSLCIKFRRFYVPIHIFFMFLLQKKIFSSIEFFRTFPYVSRLPWIWRPEYKRAFQVSNLISLPAFGLNSREWRIFYFYSQVK